MPDSQGWDREYRYKFRLPSEPQPRDNDRRGQFREREDGSRRSEERSMQELSKDIIERLEKMEQGQQELREKLEKLQKDLSKKKNSADL